MVEFLKKRVMSSEIPVLTFAKLCEMIGCTNPSRQVLRPPLQFKVDARFTGQTRETGKDLEDFLSAYDQTFPGTFQVPGTQVYGYFKTEGEFEEPVSKKKFWIPMQAPDLKKLPKTPVRISAGAYGSRNGSIRLLGLEFSSIAKKSK
jgi:hypothetical protein